MRAFAESLIDAVGIEGPVIVYSHFEKTRLKALAERYPNYEQTITEIIERFFDLLPLLVSSCDSYRSSKAFKYD